MKRKSIIITFVLLLAFAVVMSACGNNDAKPTTSQAASAPASSSQSTHQTTENKKPFVIGFSNGYFGNTWRTQLIEDIQNASKRYKDQGVLKELIIQNSNGVTEQNTVMNNFINQKVDAIIIDPVSDTGLAPAIAKAQSQGIPVVVVSEPGKYPGVINVVSDNNAFMSVYTEWMVNKLGGKGNFVYISGIAGNGLNQIRGEVIKNIVSKYPDLKMLAEAPGDWSDTKANSVMTNFLATYPKIDAVLAQDIMAKGILQAIQASKRDIKYITGDYTFGFLRKWKEAGIESISPSYVPGISADALAVTVKLLQGFKPKAEVLQKNLAHPESDEKNSIVIPMPYVVVNQLEPNAEWMKVLDPRSKVITLDEALKIGEGKPDSYILDGWFSQEHIDEMFEPVN